MEHVGDSTSWSELWLNHALAFPYMLIINLGLISIAGIVIIILQIYISILEPMNYEEDMTKEKYCKSLAEIDNRLKFRRSSISELHTSNKTQSSLDCATDLPNGSETRSVDHSHDECSDSMYAGSANHVYPNGWIPVMESYKVKPGKIKKAIVFGRDLIIHRSYDNKEIHVHDAYCPHAGANIGNGGSIKVVDNESCIECPFHGWLFKASDGQCVKIPYQKGPKSSIPKQAKLGTWTCVEVDNFIYVWHHLDGQPPSWFLESSPELSQPNWFLAGRSHHLTNLEIRNMHENGADMNHFEGIHNDIFILGSDIIKLRALKYLQNSIRHHWRPEWKPILKENGAYSHEAQMKLQSWISLFNWRLFDITINALQIGPARVKLYYDSRWYGKGLLIMNAIPMGGRRTQYIQHIYTQRTLFQSFMAKWVLYGEIKMLERDFIIWNHKKNIKNPIFTPEDKTLKQFRLWYSQFYKRKRRTITIRNSET